jgi:addiction module RelE/StbE family toxin
VQLKWTDLAEKDLDNIETYITTENSPLVAVDVVLKVLNSCELILSNHPQAGRPGRVSGTRELVINGIPLIVVYRIVDRLDQLQILRVLHDAQQWPVGD